MAAEDCSEFTGFEPNICDIIASGIDDAFFSPYNKLTVWSADTIGRIGSATTEAPVWVNCYIDPNLSKLDENLISNADFKSLDMEQSFELVFLGQSQEARNAMNQLMRGRWRIAVKAKSGEWICFGKNKGLRASAGKGTTSAKGGEESSLRLTFTTQAGPAYAPTFGAQYVSDWFE